jgi:autotransporter-associated beta strand protein
VISSVSSPRWDGQAGGTWDIGVTTNWVNLADGLPVVYNQGNTALFDDSAAGTKTVNLTTTVTPASVTFNDTVDYTLNGSGKISGTTGLTKSGSGTATIANTGANDFTGPVSLSGGTLSVASLANGGSASAIGASSAAATNLLFNGGTLGYTGPATSIDRAYTVQAGGGAISNANDLTIGGLTAAVNGGGFTKTGAGQLAYTGVGVNALAGATYGVRAGGVALGSPAGAQTNTIQGGFSVGGPVNATATLTNTTLTTSGNVDVGNVMDTVGTLTINSNATVNVGSWLTLGDGTNSTATMNLNGGTLNVNNGRLFLGSAPGTMSTLNINGGVINKSGDYFAVVNGGWNGNDARTGVVNQVDGTVNSSSEMWIGDGGGAGNLSRGTYNLSGGTLTVNNWFGIGRDGSSGVFNLSGGTLNKGVNGDMVIGRGGSFGKFVMTGGTLNKDAVNPLIVGQGGGVGELDQSGGTITTTGEYWLGVDNNTLATNNISGTASMTVHNWVTVGRNGTGVVNMSAGQFNSDSHAFIVGIWGGSQGFWNQSGGSLYVDNEIWIGQGDNNAYGTINLSGGTITNTSWLAVGREGAHGTLNITGGTMVKTGGGNISIAHNGGASGDVIISGTGTFICASGETWVGENAAPGTWTMNGGTAILGLVHLAQNADAQGLMTLNGGSLTATEISTGNNGASQRELDFNGGTLVAGADNTNFIHDLSAANVMAGGAIIDSASHSVAVNQALTGAGGLTKQGAGTLSLNGVNTYAGATLVNAGTLGGSGTIAGPVTVAAGAALAPGNSIGTLTINNTLTLAAGSTVTAEVSLDGTPSNDQVTGLTGVTYAGTLVVNNVGASPLVAGTVFKLFNSTPAGTGNFTTVTVLPSGSATFNPATGEVTITSAGAPTVNPPVLTGGALILTGTGGTPGGSYNWISSTNVAAPVANWTTNVSGVFDGSGAFSNGISILPTEPARFFRLKTP